MIGKQISFVSRIKQNTKQGKKMWQGKSQMEKKSGGNGLVAVAIDRDKGSQHALKWSIENILSRGQTVLLIHVLVRPDGSSPAGNRQQIEKQTKDLFLSFHCFCTRKDIHCLDITLEDTDPVKALSEYASYAAIENLILGASSNNGFLRRFKGSDIPTSVSKAAPDFCTVYVISKGKISSVRNASRPAPHVSPLTSQLNSQASEKVQSPRETSRSSTTRAPTPERAPFKPRVMDDDMEIVNHEIRSPFGRKGTHAHNMTGDFSDMNSDISFVSSGRPSVDRFSGGDFTDPGRNSRLSTSSDHGFCTIPPRGPKFSDLNSSSHEFSSISHDSGRSSTSENMDEVEAEMKRLKLELKQTMNMYSTACKEALTAKQKAMELNRWRAEEERRLEQAQQAEEAAIALAEKERAKCRAAMEAAEVSQRIAEREAQKRMNMEMKALQDAEEMKKTMDDFARKDVRYRRYTIEEIEEATGFFEASRKIGEGGYGPVYKCYLDHTPVAVKVLRPDASQGRSQFQQEVEVLSCIRHPNMVLLLGACPEYGCLVYEYMAKGSLEDRLFVRGNSPVLSWQLRFRIAAEIATGLLFLHQTKPEPLVHRDLKPGNILLDYNYVSKISDVGLARLVPPSVADSVTQYRMTSTAGTFCYIDPEYQQTGMLGVKSDVYSLGILLLQLITAKPPMGLTHHVEKSIEKGTFPEMLDQGVQDWPIEETLGFAKLALQCAELRRKDRPDLGTVLLPELNRLRELAEENMQPNMYFHGSNASPNNSYTSMPQEVMSDPALGRSRDSSSTSSSTIGRRSAIE